MKKNILFGCLFMINILGFGQSPTFEWVAGLFGDAKTTTANDRSVVIDNLGQTVISENCEKRRDQINIQNLKSGLYFVQLNSKDGLVTKKLIVK